MQTEVLEGTGDAVSHFLVLLIPVLWAAQDLPSSLLFPSLKSERPSTEVFEARVLSFASVVGGNCHQEPRLT
jgi:hypothetical protein